MDPGLSSGVVPADEMAQSVDGRNISEAHSLASIALLRDDVSKTISRLPAASDSASNDSVLSIYCGEASAKSCSGTTSSGEIGAQKKRTLSETSVGETSLAGASSKRPNHAIGSSRCSDVTTSDSDDSMASPTTKSMTSHHQSSRKRQSRSEIIDLTGSDEDENGRRPQLPSCAAASATVSIRTGADYLVADADVFGANALPPPINIAITPTIEVHDQVITNTGACQNPTATGGVPMGRPCHSAAVHVQICPHARCICHAHCMCCTHIHHPPATSNADPCPRYHHCELHSPCPGPCPHAHPLAGAAANSIPVIAPTSQGQTSIAPSAPNEHHYRHPCNDRMITCPAAVAAAPYPVGPAPATGSCYPQSPSMLDVHQHVFMRRRQEPPPVVNAATAFPQQQPSHMMPPPGPRSGADTQYAPGLVVPSLPTVPLSQQRLLQRQQAQMARHREAQQRWLEDRQRAYQHPAYRTNPGLTVSSSVTNTASAVPLVNSNENIATAAAAAAVAAAAATASAAFFYPTFFRAMPPQPLSMEPAAAAAAAAAVITQTTVAGPPFQLLQPQEVAVERLFTPAAQTFVSANGRAMVFHPPAINAIPSFAPYVLVDHHHHHHPHAQWAAGPITLRQLAEFMDLPQGATQQLIEQCTASHNYQPPSKAVPEGEEDKCAVCLSEFERDEHVRTLPCNHIFHVECIDRWLVFNKKCPVCRLHIDRDLQQQQNPNQSSAGGSGGGAGNQRGNYPSMASTAFPFSVHGGGRAQ